MEVIETFDCYFPGVEAINFLNGLTCMGVQRIFAN